jgi:hypothetical protein
MVFILRGPFHFVETRDMHRVSKECILSLHLQFAISYYLSALCLERKNVKTFD